MQVSKRKREKKEETTLIDNTPKRSVLCKNKFYDEQSQEKEIEIAMLEHMHAQEKNKTKESEYVREKRKTPTLLTPTEDEQWWTDSNSKTSCHYDHNQKKRKITSETTQHKDKKNTHIKELLDQNRRTTLGEKRDRRTQWTTMRKSYSPPLADEEENTSSKYNTILHAEEIDTLSKLALRLQLNKVEVTKKQDKEEHNRVHPSRKGNMDQYDKENIIALLSTEQVQKKVQEWNEKEWEEFELHNVESELPVLKENKDGTTQKTIAIDAETTEEIAVVDTPPVIYGKIGGVRAKILVDNGAKVTVISKDFVLDNNMKRSNLTTPAKLIMANGIIEPVFHKTNNISMVSGEFKHKLNAFVAPIKNYDLILGRDNLQKLAAVIAVGHHISVYNKQSESRIELTFGKKEEEIDEKSWITEETLSKELENQKGPELMIYEISITQTSTKEKIETKTYEDTSLYTEKEQKLRDEFQHIMKEELPAKLPPDRGLNHYIDMQGRMPKTAPRGFRLSEAENEFMEKHIRELLEKGLIQPCLGPYASPILVVKKPNSTDLRCVIDYRKVNEVTTADEYPQPMVQELIDKLKGAKYYSKMDLLSGFYQVRMAPEDQQKTAFRCPFGTFSFKVMPMGLKNASKTFQRMVEYALRNFIGKSVIVFIDDILVFSKTEEEHNTILRAVMKTLEENELYLKPKKCEFFRKEITFLGHVISHNCVRMDPRKIQAVKEWGKLETKKDVQRFLGFANFYRRFIEGFAIITKPLNKLLVNTPDRAAITMTEESTKAQKHLIEAITKEPILTIFDGKRETRVVTDASGDGLGAILMQLGDDKRWHPIEFQSRSLDGDQIKQTGEYRLAPRDLELCAISYALEKFRPYLAGHKFKLISDHRSLEILEDSKINSGRLARIIEQISEFDFKIEYKEGTSTIITVADALSRLPKYRKITTDEETTKRMKELEKPEENIELYEVLGLNINISEERVWGTSSVTADTKLIQEISVAYDEDEDFGKITELYKEIHKSITPIEQEKKIPKDMKFKMSNYRWDNEEQLLYRKIADTEKLCIPNKGTLRLNRLVEAHDIPLGGHFGRDKTLANIAKNFFWPGLAIDVYDFVKSCHNCQQNKAIKRGPIGLLYPHDRPQARWEKIALDFIVQLPKTKKDKYDAILTVVDFFSRRTHFIPCHGNITAIGTAQLLREHVIKIHGYPKQIVSDRGSIFTCEIWKELFRCLKAKQNLSSSYHPQTDGITEKENDIIENCIRAFTNYQQDDWCEYLPDFELAINSSISGSTGLSPQFVDTGYEPFIPLGITREIHNQSKEHTVQHLLEKLDIIKTRTQLLFAHAQEKQAKYANEKRRDIEFEEGDFIMINSDFVYDPLQTDRPSRKLSSKWLGPYRIMKRISRVAYKIFFPKEDKIKIHPVIHIANLKLYNTNPEKFLERKEIDIPIPIKDSENETVYLVDSILDMKTIRNKREFLIKWTGYELPSWEKEAQLRASPEFAEHLDQYLEELEEGKIEVLHHNKSKRNPKGKIK